jgi:ABC-type amino acid transport substrate-binding protein
MALPVRAFSSCGLIVALLVCILSFGVSCQAQSTGNVELMAAYEAALVRLMQNGSYAALFDDGDAATPLISDCVPLTSAYPFPTQNGLTAGGTLSSVISRKKLLVGVVDNDQTPYYRPVTTSSPAVVEGLLPSLEAMIASLISQQYAISPALSIEYQLFSTSNQMFNALSNGGIDMTNGFMAIGSFVNSTIRRRTAFVPSCTIFARDRNAWVLSSNNITNLAGLKGVSNLLVRIFSFRFLEPYPNMKFLQVGTSGSSNAAILVTLFGSASVKSFPEDSDVISALLAGNITAAADILVPSDAPYRSQLVEFPLGLASSSASFFRRDVVKPSDASPTASAGASSSGVACTPTGGSVVVGDAPQSVILGIAVGILAFLVVAVLAAFIYQHMRTRSHAKLQEEMDHT